MLYEAKPGEDGQAWSDALENGRIVRFARCPIELPSAPDQEFLRAQLAPWLRGKNVSFYPDADRVVGLKAPRDIVERTRGILRAHARRVRDFLSSAMPA